MTVIEKHVLYGCSRLFPCPRILTEQGLSAGLRGHATCPCWTLLSFPRGAGESPEHVSPRVTQEAPVLRVCCLTWWRQGLEHGGAAVDLEATGPSEGSQAKTSVRLCRSETAALELAFFVCSAYCSVGWLNLFGAHFTSVRLVESWSLPAFFRKARTTRTLVWPWPFRSCA